jgi:HEAT repeat protein
LQHAAAADDLLDKLAKNPNHDDELAGYCCLALGLMGYEPAKTKIRELADKSLRRPQRLQQAVIALGLLGDEGAALHLVGLLQQRHSLAVYASVATALGCTGDRAAIDPLLDCLFDRNDRQATAKAFAVVALGMIADQEPLPWNSHIARHLNYRANTETLTGHAAGVLDIQ